MEVREVSSLAACMQHSCSWHATRRYYHNSACTVAGTAVLFLFLSRMLPSGRQERQFPLIYYLLPLNPVFCADVPVTSTVVYTLGSDCTTLGSSSTVQQIHTDMTRNLVNNLGLAAEVSASSISVVSEVNSCLTAAGSGRHLLHRSSSRGLRGSDDTISVTQPSSSETPQQQQAATIMYGTLAMTLQISWPKGTGIQTAEDVGLHSWKFAIRLFKDGCHF